MVDLNKFVNNVARIADALERLADAKDAGSVALPKAQTTTTAPAAKPQPAAAAPSAKKEAEDEW